MLKLNNFSKRCRLGAYIFFRYLFIDAYNIKKEDKIVYTKSQIFAENIWMKCILKKINIQFSIGIMYNDCGAAA